MRLTAYLDGARVGWFEQQRGDSAITLVYDVAWQRRIGRLEMSWSLPKSRRKHTGAAPGNYLWNLLPDNDDVLERWADGPGCHRAIRSRCSRTSASTPPVRCS